MKRNLLLICIALLPDKHKIVYTQNTTHSVSPNTCKILIVEENHTVSKQLLVILIINSMTFLYKLCGSKFRMFCRIVLLGERNSISTLYRTASLHLLILQQIERK